MSGEPPADGLPVSLEAIIRATGIRAFKIKLKGDPQADIARLSAIAGLVGTMDDLRVTLDANEQYTTDRFAAFLDLLIADQALGPFRRAIAFIEQPFARETALSLEITPELGRFPLIIDESDDHDGAFATAVSRGWSGTSIKSCKGVLRALLNHARVQTARARGQSLFISAEDLTCQPGLCWQQDTLVAATLGCRDVERNGHHFGGGCRAMTNSRRPGFWPLIRISIKRPGAISACVSRTGRLPSARCSIPVSRGNAGLSAHY
nr:enolase C-terminal domain-like protein [Marinicella sp. W31]MDC2879705.1 enolase C-terminal domain-like protein [Marinicella sp. W31]